MLGFSADCQIESADWGLPKNFTATAPPTWERVMLALRGWLQSRSFH